MTIEELTAHVDAELFRRTCETAWATASTSGRGRGDDWPADQADVPHELSDLFAGDAALGFELYRAMPCFAVLMYVGFEPHDEAFWTEVRSLLDDPDDRLARPMAYWLWCGPLESAAEVEDCWRKLVTDAPDQRLRRLLDISGPVPWRLKGELLERLAQQSEWNDAVRAALDAAASEVFGQVKPES
ncbi:hypothetical protein AB0P21_21965 [Kribbella sp. NPDC056861]|uniref:hypothetical protein n=1 Tax=Kribbella sp. NPDC056861 TaxID=3154857 RepID=UPI0034490C9D